MPYDLHGQVVNWNKSLY